MKSGQELAKIDGTFGTIQAVVDLITASGIQFCAQDAFCVKEVYIGMAAGVGTLQRLPKLISAASII